MVWVVYTKDEDTGHYEPPISVHYTVEEAIDYYIHNKYFMGRLKASYTLYDDSSYAIVELYDDDLHLSSLIIERFEIV